MCGRVSVLHHSLRYRSPISRVPHTESAIRGIQRIEGPIHLRLTRLPLTLAMLGQMLRRLERASLKQHDCLMLRAALTLGFFSFLWDGKFTMKNRSFNPRFHPTMQDSSRSREGVCYLKSSRKLTKWAEMPHFYWVYIPKYVSSGSNGGRYGMLQLFSHSTPLFHYRDGMPLTAKVLPLGFSTPDRAMWLQCSQIQYTQLFLHTSPLKKDDVVSA